MPIEMKYLLYTVALAALQVALAGAGNVLGAGLPAAAGNRANMPEPAGWAGRAGRAHRNLLESLVLFVALVVVGQATGKFNAMTALGSEIFFWGRVAGLHPLGETRNSGTVCFCICHPQPCG
jgi:uncharacterized MAPEG superfamily protein